MAITALHSASTGLSSLSTEIDVIANNLANVNTVGFKTFRTNLEDLMYQEKRQPGVENANGDQSPAGLYVGLGTQVSNTQQSFEQGSPVATGQPLDLMIDGPGFFQVSILQETGGGVGVARAGNIVPHVDGVVGLGHVVGPRLEPPINIPQDVTRIAISSDGTVNGFNDTDAEAVNLGQIQLATFINPAGLTAIGGNLWVESAASGPPIQGNPSEAGFGTILQSHLEGSNVDPVKELVALIKTQRAFELNSQSIQAADQALQVISNLRRF
jgi:flagellar basal-body rod protein FlgG